MRVDLSIEEIYKEEIDLAKSIVVKVQQYKNKIPYNTVVFGTKYKAYLNNDGKFVVCSCEKKSIENRIKLFNKQYFVAMNKQWKYFDYVYNKHIDNPTLECFLGLPKELNIDYSKDVIPQITFEDEICHRCCGVDYQFLIQPEDAKIKVDRRREIEKENYFISKGFHYVPLYKKSYLIIDELKDEDKKELLFEFNEFPIKEKVCVGYQKFIDNPNKEKQIEDIKAIMEMPVDIQLYILYVDKRALKTAMQSFKSEDFEIFDKIEQVCNKKVRKLQEKYLMDFPNSTSPAYELKKLYDIIQDEFENYNDFLYIVNDGCDELNEDEKDEFERLSKLEEILTKYLEQYIDYGGDVFIQYYNYENIVDYPFLELLDLVGGPKLKEKAGIKVEYIKGVL